MGKVSEKPAESDHASNNPVRNPDALLQLKLAFEAEIRFKDTVKAVEAKLSKMQEILDWANLMGLEEFLQPKKADAEAFTTVWEEEQKTLMQGLQGQELHLAGDGRADSPGYSALFGTYSLLETSTNKIIHVEVVQSTEVKSSGHMEPEGLRRSLKKLEEQHLSIKSLTTDRHTQVKSVLKEFPTIVHLFDLWHVIKEYVKRLTEALFVRILKYPTFKMAKRAHIKTSRPSLSSTLAPRPDLEVAVAQHQPRFNPRHIS
ncbi:hypothetical protein HPB50_007878 [Hyalomma asiaticum]|uniref:Uncharacterized protein n=1 Tax=Hyalomma asiaticum TaxID=266040 RepID=A0ACB7TKE6_HYAAI|nr:hypothetical protein HPB50_007878 [Hyalomma asiaticum]